MTWSTLILLGKVARTQSACCATALRRVPSTTAVCLTPFPALMRLGASWLMFFFVCEPFVSVWIVCWRGKDALRTARLISSVSFKKCSSAVCSLCSHFSESRSSLQMRWQNRFNRTRSDNEPMSFVCFLCPPAFVRVGSCFLVCTFAAELVCVSARVRACVCVYARAVSPVNYWWLFVTSINILSATSLAAG